MVVFYLFWGLKVCLHCFSVFGGVEGGRTFGGALTHVVASEVSIFSAEENREAEQAKGRKQVEEEQPPVSSWSCHKSEYRRMKTRERAIGQSGTHLEQLSVPQTLNSCWSETGRVRK